ncbi:hypothetical protein [Collimonas humicola]|uniref:hypothetical protein n=1 Tax=Collimonas humicola TaxID=2825886 RepID=UPI001B8BBB58|nr:hypothetical protein [Collimonas humicola]
MKNILIRTGLNIQMTALLLLFMSPIACAASHAPSIVRSFDIFWAAAQDKPFAQQEKLWDEFIEQDREDLYQAVVWEADHHPDWRGRKHRILQSRFASYSGLANQIADAAARLEVDISRQGAKFRTVFADAPESPDAQIILAPNFDAKSGVLADGSCVLVFAIDSLILEKANMDVVIPHELFHLYHANHAGIKNDGVMAGADLTLPLFEEGLATYVSTQLSPGYKDEEYLLQEDLGSLQDQRLPEIARRFLTDADFLAIDRLHPDAFNRWFNSSTTKVNADLPNRTGYWLGLAVIRYLRQSYSLSDIASWRPDQAQMRAREVLTALASSLNQERPLSSNN